MKFGIDAPWYNDPVERLAFNAYAMHEQEKMDVINYINEYDEDDFATACAAVGSDCYNFDEDEIRYIAHETGREINGY